MQQRHQLKTMESTLRHFAGERLAFLAERPVLQLSQQPVLRREARRLLRVAAPRVAARRIAVVRAAAARAAARQIAARRIPRLSQQALQTPSSPARRAIRAFRRAPE